MTSRIGNIKTKDLKASLLELPEIRHAEVLMYYEDDRLKLFITVFLNPIVMSPSNRKDALEAIENNETVATNADIVLNNLFFTVYITENREKNLRYKLILGSSEPNDVHNQGAIIPHPHWRGSYHCFGDFGPAISHSVANLDIESMVVVLLMFLQQYNPTDEIGQHFIRWLQNDYQRNQLLYDNDEDEDEDDYEYYDDDD